MNPAPPSPEPILTRAARLLAIAGGLVLVASALTVTTSVTMRATGLQGVPGDFELVQMGLALAVFAFLPLCQSRRGNIMVDTFTLWLPRGVQAAIDALWDVVLAAIGLLLAWRMALGAKGAFSSATTTMVLGMPIGWAIAGCAAMAAFLAAISIQTAARRLRAAR